MEKDSMIAHGAAFLLHDRMMNSSDRHIATVCEKCGSLLTSVAVPSSQAPKSIFKQKTRMMCNACKSLTSIREIPLPYVTRYLANELAAMNIKLSFDVKKIPM